MLCIDAQRQAALEELNTRMLRMVERNRTLTPLEEDFVVKVRKLNRLVKTGCAPFRFFFSLGDVYAALSALKYEEYAGCYRRLYEIYAR